LSLASAHRALAQPSPFTLREASSTLGSWHTLGGTPYRSFRSDAPLPSLLQHSWLRTFDATGARIRWIGQVAPVVTSELVLAPGIVSPAGGPANQLRLFALARNTGTIVWSAPLAASAAVLTLESQAAPTIDLASASVLIAHAGTLSCLSLHDGSLRWQTALPRLVVNASPVLATDAPGAHRVFLTTFDAALGTAGELLCINISPFDATRNPFAPGAILWRAPIGGSSGNSPAFLPSALGGAGLVYVSSTGAYGASPAVPGTIFAFSALATTLPAPTWATTNTTAEGFYSGVSLALDRVHPRPPLAASSYAFAGGLSSANTLVLDAGTGSVLACSSSNRTSATPIWLPDAGLLLSTGLASASVADTAPSLDRFIPLPLWPSLCTDARAWNSALNTWTDTNNDNLLSQGEFFAVGHYIHHPALSLFAGSARVAAGSAPTGDRVGPPTQLHALDLAQLPSAPDFVVATANTQVGASPALAGLNLYSSGAAGLAAFGPPPAALDVDASGLATLADLHAWEAGQGSRDINADGLTNQADRDTLALALRTRERFALLHLALPTLGGAP
jgi:outer membrane protein assembly factor BamB